MLKHKCCGKLPPKQPKPARPEPTVPVPTVDRQIGVLIGQIERLSEDADDHREIVSEYMAEIAALTTQRDELRVEVLRLRKSADAFAEDADAFAEDLALAKKANGSLAAKLNAANATISNMDEALKVGEVIRQDQTKMIAELHARVNALCDDRNVLELEKDQLRENGKNLEETLNMAIARNGELIDKLDRLQRPSGFVTAAEVAGMAEEMSKASPRCVRCQKPLVVDRCPTCK